MTIRSHPLEFEDNVIPSCSARARYYRGISQTMSSVSGVSRNTLRFYATAAFLIGLLQPVTIVFVGKMPLSEPLLVLVLLHGAVAVAQARVFQHRSRPRALSPCS